MRRGIVFRLVLALSLTANAGLLAWRSGVFQRMREGRATVGDGQHWENRQTVFSILPATERRPVVFAGDSLIELCEWGELLQRADVVNRGIGFDTTEGFLQRVDSVAALHPRALFLMIGINDPPVLGSTPGETAGRYGRILDRLRSGSPDTSVYVQSLLPVEERASGRKNAWVREVNGLLRRLAAERGMTYVELGADFVGPGGELSPLLTTDGIHLSGEGYRVWARKVVGLLPGTTY